MRAVCTNLKQCLLRCLIIGHVFIFVALDHVLPASGAPVCNDSTASSFGHKSWRQRCYFNSDSPLQPHPAWRHRRDIDHRLPCWWSSRLDRTQAPAVRPPHSVSSGERVTLLLRQPIHLSAASHQRLQLQQLVPGSCRRRQRQLHRHHSSPCRAIQTTLIPGVVKDCALHRNLHSSRGNLGASVYTRFSTPDLFLNPLTLFSIVHVGLLPLCLTTKITTRHRTSTEHSLTFRVRLCCHSNETCAPIANLPSSARAQLEGTPTIPPSYIRIRAVVWECGEGQTDT